jgi:hypothetical protein
MQVDKATAEELHKPLEILIITRFEEFYWQYFQPRLSIVGS